MRTILFEDHTAARFRPLAWSWPTPEIRCGLFSLRERCNLLGMAGGGLAIRSGLAGLPGDPAWDRRPADGPALWLNGRLAPDGAFVKALCAAASAGHFALIDEAGPLALHLPPQAAVASSWAAWERGCNESADAPLPAWIPPVPGEWPAAALGDGLSWLAPVAGGAPVPAKAPAGLGWIWDVVPRTAAALEADIALVAGHPFNRRPWGIAAASEAQAAWLPLSALRPATADLWTGAHIVGQGPVLSADGVTVLPGAVLDTRNGPIVLEAGAAIGANAYLEGPLALGPGCRVKAGAAIYGESSFGVGCRIAGEIGESTFGDFSNKQHEGFIGHAVLGSWVNLGALTTCSDLKNNYGSVRVDLGFGSLDTGLRFVGLMMGDHAKTAIGTLFNTGTCVGFAANVFGTGMPPKLVPSFSWGGRDGDPAYAVEKAAATAAVVMGRRDCLFLESHGDLFRSLGS